MPVNFDWPTLAAGLTKVVCHLDTSDASILKLKSVAIHLVFFLIHYMVIILQIVFYIHYLSTSLAGLF